MKYICYFVFVALLLSSCKQNSVQPIEEPPEFPDFTYAFPDVSYFDLDSSFKAKMPSNNYAEAAGYIMATTMTFTTIQLYNDLFSMIDFENWDYKNGIWSWNHEMTMDGIHIKYKITAQLSGDEYIWNMYTSYDMQGFQVEETRIIEARVSTSGDEGTWTIFGLFSLEDEPLVVTDWKKLSENKWELTSTISYSENPLVLDYTKDEDLNLLSINQPDIDDLILIVWDSSTKVGSIQYGTDEATRKCWDAELEDISCSEIDI